MGGFGPLSEADIDAAHASARIVVETHRRLAGFLSRGQTLAEIDAFVAKQLEDQKSRSCFLGYRVGRLPPFPSHACLSVNECVVHGTAGSLLRPLREGDVLKVDIGVTHKGWIGDAAWTYVFGTPADDIARLMRAGKESLKRGVAQIRPENTWLKFAEAVQDTVEKEYRLHLVRGLGGHGYGRKLHAPPYVSNTRPTYAGEWPEAKERCAPGTLVAVEPMLAMGTSETAQEPKGWPVLTADGSMSVHYEHDVLVTDGAPRVLTAGLEELPDVIER